MPPKSCQSGPDTCTRFLGVCTSIKYAMEGLAEDQKKTEERVAKAEKEIRDMKKAQTDMRKKMQQVEATVTADHDRLGDAEVRERVLEVRAENLERDAVGQKRRLEETSEQTRKVQTKLNRVGGLAIQVLNELASTSESTAPVPDTAPETAPATSSETEKKRRRSPVKKHHIDIFKLNAEQQAQLREQFWQRMNSIPKNIGNFGYFTPVPKHGPYITEDKRPGNVKSRRFYVFTSQAVNLFFKSFYTAEEAKTYMNAVLKVLHVQILWETEDHKKYRIVRTKSATMQEAPTCARASCPQPPPCAPSSLGAS